MNDIVLVASDERAGARLDKFLSENIQNLTRTAAAALIEGGCCMVNGVVCAKNYKLKAGDTVMVTLPEAENTDILPEDIPLDIRYEDDELLVVNKPRGMVVHPANGHYSGTLVNALIYYCGDSLSGINGVIRPGIVHRLDRNTSGLLLVAKNDKAHNALCAQLANREVLREYEAVVHGNVKQNGEVKAPIGRSTADRKKMCVTEKNSREAVTHYEVIENHKKFTHLRLFLKTGRTHQIRVHMAYIGHPVAGDDVYGNGGPKWLEGQCLHAKRLMFTHPKSGEQVEITSELPEYFEKMLNEISR